MRVGRALKEGGLLPQRFLVGVSRAPGCQALGTMMPNTAQHASLPYVRHALGPQEVLYKLAPGVRGGGVGAPQPAMQLPVPRPPAGAAAAASNKTA